MMRLRNTGFDTSSALYVFMFNSVADPKTFFFGFGSTQFFFYSDTDSGDIYFGANHSKVIFQCPANIF
jgi:hypothetical protein